MTDSWRAHPPAPAPTWDDTVLTAAQMGQADAWAATHGVAGAQLMARAGEGVGRAIARRWSARPTLVLCGPGNNGGDGWVVARWLAERGWPVEVACDHDLNTLLGDAAIHANAWRRSQEEAGRCPQPLSLAEAVVQMPRQAVVIDALFGAGLCRPLQEGARAVLSQAQALGLIVVAVDVPSGVHGDHADTLDGLPVPAPANLTVTFMGPKPAHLLHPGRRWCGEIEVVDIGIAPGALSDLQANASAPLARLNGPTLWAAQWQAPEVTAHKYHRGHVLAFSGPQMPGASRLAARAAARMGAGLVTLAATSSAWPRLAGSLMSTMAHPLADDTPRALVDDWQALLRSRRWGSVVLGPGAVLGLPGDGVQTLRELVLGAVSHQAPLVLDADALTAFEHDPAPLMAALRERRARDAGRVSVVLTPHSGEFDRLFGGDARDKLTRTRSAAGRAGAVVLHKGPDTVVADPDGHTVVNTLAPVWLATAGSGDVLAGFIAGLMAQGVNALPAACAAAWVHGACAQAFGPGLLAEDLPEQVPGVLRRLWAQ